ncbi:MAG: tetratricopeptide repeat protein [Chloroflexi bacterium]|nr:tetratricopeptide repeat protein [Chloroflexota bacterium]
MRRVRSEKAIQLAAQNRWQEAVDVNRQIIDAFPKDVDAHNRLGKALMELGAYADARDAYGGAAQLDPSNTIASKNLARLAKLAEEAPAGAVAPPSAPVDPRLFIEESGKTAVTNLVDVASFEKIATLTAGDKMEVKVEQGVVRVSDPTGNVVGQLEPKIAQRVIKLSELGNRYAAAITSIDESHVRVIIREAFRHPSLGSRPSFPTRAPEIRPYTKDSVFRTDFDDEDDDDLTEEADVEPGDAPEAALDDAPAADENTLDDDS